MIMTTTMLTSGQSNLTQGRIAVAHGRFNRIRQVAPVHPISHMLPWAHPCPHPKRHVDWFSRFCAAHGRESVYFTKGRTFPLKIAHSHGRIWTPSNTWFLGPTRVYNPNGVSIGSIVYAGVTIVTDRPTDRPRYSVCNNRPRLRSTAMRPNNNNNKL